LAVFSAIAWNFTGKFYQHLGIRCAHTYTYYKMHKIHGNVIQPKMFVQSGSTFKLLAIFDIHII